MCNVGYSTQQCRTQAAALRSKLARYAPKQAPEWTWVLVRSGDWKPLKQRLGMNPESPAFSFMERRETFLDEALLAPVPGRSAELIRGWSSSMDDILVLAITHELGHAVCREPDELKADGYGKMLRAGKPFVCR